MNRHQRAVDLTDRGLPALDSLLSLPLSIVKGKISGRRFFLGTIRAILRVYFPGRHSHSQPR
jgi:hypothetical protein